MKPPPFQYASPTSVSDAVALLVEHADEEPRVLAGGQSLVPLMNFRLAQPGYLVDLRRVAGLDTIRPGDANEVAMAWKVALSHTREPTALIFSRQAIQTLDREKYASADGLERGKRVVEFPLPMSMATRAMRHLPDAIYDAVMTRGAGVKKT